MSTQKTSGPQARLLSKSIIISADRTKCDASQRKEPSQDQQKRITLYPSFYVLPILAQLSTIETLTSFAICSTVALVPSANSTPSSDREMPSQSCCPGNIRCNSYLPARSHPPVVPPYILLTSAEIIRSTWPGLHHK